MALNHSPPVVTNGLVYYHDMSNTQKSWKGAPTTNLVSTTPYTLTTYAYCTGPVSTDNILDATGQPRTVNRYIITSTGLTPRGRIITTGLSANINYSFSCKIKYNGGAIPSWYIDSSKGNPEGSNNTFNSRTQTFVDIGNGWYQLIENFNFATCPTGGSYSNFGFAAPDASFLNQTFDVYDIQFEQNAFATPYVNGTRSNTQAITDLVGGNTITASSLTYNSNGTFSFNGTSDEALINYTSSLSQFTVEIWAYPTGWSGLEPCAIADSYPGSTSKVNYMIEMLNASTWRAGTYQAGWYYSPTVTATLNVWQHVVYSFDGTNQTIYLNGVSGGSTTTYSGIPGSSAVGVKLGRRWDSANFFQGQLGVSKIYNRALSASEVLQNFNALKGRYGL